MAGETRGNGETDALPTAADGPQLFINLQYIKDFSFENPRAPQSLIQQPAQPEVAINVDVTAHNLNPDTYEVVLTINVTARMQEEPVFLVELIYAAVVTVRNAPRADAGELASGRVATDHLPVCSRRHRQRDPRRGFSAADDQPDRLCRTVAPPPIPTAARHGRGRGGSLSFRYRRATAAPSAAPAAPGARRAPRPRRRAGAGGGRPESRWR